MAATFGKKFITRTDLDHPTRLGTPRESHMMEVLISPACHVHRTYGADEADLAPEFARTIADLDPFQA